VIAIANAGSFSRAADELQVAQPTLSKYIQKLEKSIGIELFDRSTIPIRLTAAGELYVAAGKGLIDHDRQLRKQLQEVSYRHSLEVRVGISPSRAPYLMPSVLSKYLAGGGGRGKLIVQEGTVSGLKERLITGDLDLIISLADDDTVALESVDLFRETILLAVPKSLDRHSTTEEMLRELPHISVGRGQYMWQVMNKVLGALGGREPTIECQSIESAMAMVRHGIGVMLVPSYIRDYGTAEQNKNVRFYQLPLDQHPSLEAMTNRQVCLFYRKEQFLTQAERSFIQCAKAVAQEARQRGVDV
jgi:DNA-binding transcriptional LysR family regulator